MPVIGMAALATGKKTAAMTADDLPAIKDVLLKWKSNARLVGEVTASQTALATGEADILVGGGEWVTAVLAAENPALDFSIPEEGGMKTEDRRLHSLPEERKRLAQRNPHPPPQRNRYRDPRDDEHDPHARPRHRVLTGRRRGWCGTSGPFARSAASCSSLM